MVTADHEPHSSSVRPADLRWVPHCFSYGEHPASFHLPTPARPPPPPHYLLAMAAIQPPHSRRKTSHALPSSNTAIPATLLATAPTLTSPPLPSPEPRSSGKRRLTTSLGSFFKGGSKARWESSAGTSEEGGIVRPSADGQNLPPNPSSSTPPTSSATPRSRPPVSLPSFLLPLRASSHSDSPAPRPSIVESPISAPGPEPRRRHSLGRLADWASRSALFGPPPSPAPARPRAASEDDARASFFPPSPLAARLDDGDSQRPSGERTNSGDTGASESGSGMGSESGGGSSSAPTTVEELSEREGSREGSARRGSESSGGSREREGSEEAREGTASVSEEGEGE